MAKKKMLPKQTSAEIIQSKARNGILAILEGVFRKGNLGDIGELIAARSGMGQTDSQNTLIKLLLSLHNSPRTIIQNADQMQNNFNPELHQRTDSGEDGYASSAPERNKEIVLINAKGEARKKRQKKEPSPA